MAHASSRAGSSLTNAIVLAGVLASLLVFAPYAGVAVASIWAAYLARPVMETTARWLGGRQRAGAVVTVMIVVVMIAPVAIVATVAATAARDVVHRLQESPEILALFSTFHVNAGESAVRAARVFGESATRIVIGVALFVVGAYSWLVDGERARVWLIERMPWDPAKSERLADAFDECGRGLFVGVLLTALAQGVAATGIYFALGIRHAALLGALTFLAAFVPLVGTSVVWIPLAASLALDGRATTSVILAVLGIAVIGTIDNVLRPYFARSGRLKLPTWIVALSMFGGLALLGFQGLILGPLIVRLTKELLAISRDEPTD
jgi:predicted PurR-regulated permease PerM